MLVFNTTVVYADVHGGSGGSLDDPTKLYPALFDENGNFKPPAGQELFNHMIVGDKTGSVLAPILSTLSSFLDGYDNSNGQGISVETNSGGSTVHFHGSFIDELNTALQDKVHALDGYYLVEPEYSYELNTLNANTGNRINNNNYDSSSYEYVVENFNKYTNCYHWYTTGNDSCYNVLFFNANYLYIGEGGIMQTEESLTYSKSTCYAMAIGSGSASKSSSMR